MWKDSYQIGIDIIDTQHKELFRMVDELLKAITAEADSSTFKEAIEFLKNYVAKHFSAEEAYQESISYCGIEEHKKIHRTFTDTVLEYERRLAESDYDIRVVKDLAGLLTTWLNYHVAGADQRIVKNLPLVEASEKLSCIDSITASLASVLETMAGLPPDNMKKSVILGSHIDGDIIVDMWLTGAVSGHAYFSFSKELSFKLIENLMRSAPSEVDELICSALGEFVNITVGNAATILSKDGLCNITTPTVSLNGTRRGVFETVLIDTGIGDLAISMEMCRP